MIYQSIRNYGDANNSLLDLLDFFSILEAFLGLKAPPMINNMTATSIEY
jgi:hypothetical protein